MTDFSTSTPQEIAQEVDQGVDAVKAFAKLPNDLKVQVVKHMLDQEIGTDDGAALKALPGMTPEITEMVTDPLLDMLAKVVVKRFLAV